jgi:hypothetical protein
LSLEYVLPGNEPMTEGSCFYGSFLTGGLLVACNLGKPPLKIGSKGFRSEAEKPLTEAYSFMVFGFELFVGSEGSTPANRMG